MGVCATFSHCATDATYVGGGGGCDLLGGKTNGALE